jgi:hypothetical protein
MVLGFFFWAELGEVMRIINARGRRAGALIIWLILTNKIAFCGPRSQKL